MPSPVLVAAQFGLAAALLASCWPPAGDWSLFAGLLLVAAALLGIAALAANRPGNFNIRPELKPGAHLVTGGVYRWLRHPMYAAFLLATLALALLDPRPWRWLTWLALLAVLLAKAQREEGYLLQRFEDYAAYRAKTWRLLPWIY